MKPNNPKFWMLLSGAYLVFLFVYILICNPSFNDIKNYFSLIPLYLPILISTYLKHKNDEYASGEIWDTKYFLIFSTVLVVVFKIIAECLR